MRTPFTRRSPTIAFAAFLAVTSVAPAIDPGDANEDGTINTIDAMLVADMLLGRTTPPGRVDANLTGSVDVADCVTIVNTVRANADLFEVSEFFPLDNDSSWSLTDNGGGEDDGFTWDVARTTIAVDGDRQATRIVTTTDVESHPRNGFEEFWFVDPNGDLLFCGFRQNLGLDLLPTQNIVLNEPMKIGGSNQAIGSVVEDESVAPIINILGALSADVTSMTRFNKFIAAKETPAGIFTNVLHVSIDINFTLVTPIGNLAFPVDRSTYFLKRGVGLIAIDLVPDSQDAELVEFRAGQVAGVEIMPDI